MRVNAPGLTVKAVWDYTTAAAIIAGTLGKLITDNIDAPVSGAKADVSALALEATLGSPAGANIVADIAAVLAAMRGTDGAAVASVWTAALATALGNYTAARAAKLDDIGTGAALSASETLQLSSDAEVTVTTTGYLKKKEFQVTISGTLRMKVDLKGDGTNSVNTLVYINGVDAGITQMNKLQTTYETKTSDDFPVVYGDLVQLYGKMESGAGPGYIQNCRLCATITAGVIGVVM